MTLFVKYEFIKKKREKKSIKSVATVAHVFDLIVHVRFICFTNN